MVEVGGVGFVSDFLDKFLLNNSYANEFAIMVYDCNGPARERSFKLLLIIVEINDAVCGVFDFSSF